MIRLGLCSLFQNNIAEVKEFRIQLMREDFLMMTK